ncbi:hypothetical protein QYF61_024056 [Mycteria americana]|uniref:Rna-directed dna polymerase from mobile element jockey-like n=1 Tax=Mycteria americana TaxID=33587 RepID=A0AAN7NXL4_MYCAM|nr:hypothetical protein QYF61_024056 [Mycteria americana]
MDQIPLEAISKHMKGKMVTGSSQHRFTKGKTCLTNLIAFYHKITILVDKGRALDVVYLDFSKHFNAASHNILMDKLMKYGIDIKLGGKVDTPDGCAAIQRDLNRQEMGQSILAAIRKNTASKLREFILPLCLALVRPPLECCVHCWVLQYKKDTAILE